MGTAACAAPWAGQQPAGARSARHRPRPGTRTRTHREVLLGPEVLVQVDAGAAVLLHGVTGQQLSGREEESFSAQATRDAASEAAGWDAKSHVAPSRPRPAVGRGTETEAHHVPRGCAGPSSVSGTGTQRRGDPGGSAWATHHHSTTPGSVGPPSCLCPAGTGRKPHSQVPLGPGSCSAPVPLWAGDAHHRLTPGASRHGRGRVSEHRGQGLHRRTPVLLTIAFHARTSSSSGKCGWEGNPCARSPGSAPEPRREGAHGSGALALGREPGRTREKGRGFERPSPPAGNHLGHVRSRTPGSDDGCYVWRHVKNSARKVAKYDPPSVKERSTGTGREGQKVAKSARKQAS